jgi:imidazolonepropionase-like amidohydrolase
MTMIDRPTAATRATVLRGARIFDGRSDQLSEPSDIVIDPSGMIVEILAAGTADLGAGHRLVELDGLTIAPGLINMHVHLGLALPGAAGELVASSGDADMTLTMADSARRTLDAGITTVRLVGESRYLDFALRRGIRSGAIDGPHIFTAGHALCCTGGHGWDSDALEGDGAEDFRRLARLQIREGADWIKVCISGGIAGEHEQIDTPQLFDDELEAVIEVAHAWGRKVTAHVGPTPALTRAIELGLDCVEHGYQLDTAVTDLMAERGVWYVPTITVSRCGEFFDEQGVPSWLKERAMGAGPRHWESLQNAIASGVRIAMGTDMPPAANFDGTTATVREMEFMEEAGMSPLEVMRSATSAAAELLGESQAGVIAPGMRADLIAIDGDPLASVSALRELRWVMKAGRVYRDDRIAEQDR